MTVLILDRGEGPLPPYLEWLESGDGDAVLFTGRPPGAVSGDDRSRYADVRSFPDYDASSRMERDAVRLAATVTIGAIVALAPGDAIRAGALRDLLGVGGQGRADAIASQDLVAARDRLRQAGVPTLACGVVRRISDLYWYGHDWGYPVRVRHRRAPGWPTAAELRDESDVIAFTRGGLSPKLESVPSLVAEPIVPVDRPRVVVSRRQDGSWCVPPGCPAPAAAIARAAVGRFSVSGGTGWRVEMANATGDHWCVDTVEQDRGALRTRVREQAGGGERSRRAIR